MTVTSRLHRQKGKERQRKTGENGPKIRVRGRGSSTCAPGSGPRIAFAKNLRGQGSRLSAGQAEGCPHAPEEAAPSPTVGFRVIIDGLVPIPEVTLSLVVGNEIQQAKKIPMNASRGGDYRRKESPAHIQCRVVIGDGRFDSRQNPAPAMEHKQERSGSISVCVVCD